MAVRHPPDRPDVKTIAVAAGGAIFLVSVAKLIPVSETLSGPIEICAAFLGFLLGYMLTKERPVETGP